MLPKSQISLLRSLQRKKERWENGLFLVEGYKSVVEFIKSSYAIAAIYHTTSFDPKVLNLSQKINLYPTSVADAEKISVLKAPPDVIALVKIPGKQTLNNKILANKFSLVLDGIQDPGNLGTIIRTADWFGLSHIVCSEDTVDAYNSKAVQASMGSLSRVNIHYTSLEATLPALKLPVFGAALHGESIYKTDFGAEGLIVLGNEGNGIRPGLQKLVSRAVTIPRTGKAESLNVGVAAAIFCSEISRN